MRMVSDNAKIFKAAKKTIVSVLDSAEVKHHISGVSVKWNFNLEKAPWWGGMFERMIQGMKRCLQKTIGNDI